MVSKRLSLKALDPTKPIMSFVASSNHKNDLPQTVYVKLDKDDYLLWKSLVLPLIRLQTRWLYARDKKLSRTNFHLSWHNQENQSWLWGLVSSWLSPLRTEDEFYGNWYCNSSATLQNLQGTLGWSSKPCRCIHQIKNHLPEIIISQHPQKRDEDEQNTLLRWRILLTN